MFANWFIIFDYKAKVSVTPAAILVPNYETAATSLAPDDKRGPIIRDAS